MNPAQDIFSSVASKLKSQVYIGLYSFHVPDVNKACERFEKLGVEFVKKPDAGTMKGLAFIKVTCLMGTAQVSKCPCGCLTLKLFILHRTHQMYVLHAGPRWLLDRNPEWAKLSKVGVTTAYTCVALYSPADDLTAKCLHALLRLCLIRAYVNLDHVLPVLLHSSVST